MSHHFAHESGGQAFCMFDQQGYPSIFRLSDEIPRFSVVYRWWEDEETTLLWTFNEQELRRAIRFRLFHNEQLPRVALQGRDESTINNFVEPLLERHEMVLLTNLSHMEKVEEIIRRCKGPVPPLVSWGWLPAQKHGSWDPPAIAMAIDTESHLQFSRIPFEDMVRYSLGYAPGRVEWFLQQHTAFYAHLLDHFSIFPEDLVMYVEVEKHLRNRSPFAHRAVARALQDAGLQVDLPNATPGFEFIAGPIQRLFRDVEPGLSALHKVLCLLGTRFERTYAHTRHINWTRPFNIAFAFLEDLLVSASPKDFARTLTSADEKAFAALIEQNTFDEGLANRLCMQWEQLSMDVWECCMALPDTIDYIQECSKHLLAFRNYHSLTALLSGLHKYSLSVSLRTDNGTALPPIVPPEYSVLLHPYQNYASYRRQYLQDPGIPFILPHLREFRQHGEPELQYLFQQLRNIIS